MRLSGFTGVSVKVAVIGNGISGITTGVALLEEKLTPVVFGLSKELGGVWSKDGKAWPGMTVNISQLTGHFSNYPWPKDAPYFPTSEAMYDYSYDYADHFGLLPHMKFGCLVTEVLQKEDKWLVKWLENDQKHEAIFDGVVLATGKFMNPLLPKIPGIEKLTSSCHSAQYKSTKEFKKKKVLVVGNSFSGASIAKELADDPDVAEVINLFRNPRWIVGRKRSSDPLNNGPFLPRDLLKTYNDFLNEPSAEEEYKFMLQHYSAQNKYPEWEMLPSSPVGFTVVDNYFDPVKAGKLKPVRAKIKQFSENSVELEDGRILNFDTVIFATGYHPPQFPMLSSELAKIVKDSSYEETFPVGLQNLAVVGHYNGARGSVLPLSNIQARVIARVFSGAEKLPSVEVMTKQIQNTPAKRNEVVFSSALAEIIGVNPDLKLLNEDERLMLSQGAFTCERFRINGPHSNFKQALEAIKEVNELRKKLLQSNNKTQSPVVLIGPFFDKGKSLEIAAEKLSLQL